MTPWAGRRLHFIGIGGAGMSGLALVARTLGAEVTGSDRADSSYCEPLRAAGIEPVIGHDAANVPEGAEVVVSTAIAADNPELAARERGQRCCTAATCWPRSRALKRCIAVSRHAREDHHRRRWSPTCCVETGRDAVVPDRRRAAPTGPNAAWGDGRVDGRRGRRVRPLVPQARPEVAVVTNIGARPPRDLRARELELERAFAEFVRPRRERAIAVARGAALDRAPTLALRDRRGRPRAPSDVELDARGSRFTVDGVERRAARAGRAQRAERARRAGRLPRGRASRSAEAAPRARDLPGRRAPLRAARATAPAAPRVYDDYAHHPTEVRGDARGGAHARARGAWSPASSRTSTRARGARARVRARARAGRRRRACSTSTRRASDAEDFPGVTGWLVAAAAADAAGGRPVYWTPAMDDAERLLAAELRRGRPAADAGRGRRGSRWRAGWLAPGCAP